jgi:hypothetical protein
MQRPYEYRLTYDWAGECLREGNKGFRTTAEGERQDFDNTGFKGDVPASVIEAEHALYEIMNKRTDRKSPKKLIVIIKGDQAQEDSSSSGQS